MAGKTSAKNGGIYPRGFSLDADWPWPLVKSDQVVRLNYGKALREPDRRTGHIPVYGTNGRCGWHDTALQDGPGVILGRKGQGPLGVEWCDTSFWVIDTAYFATPKTDQLALRYFYYLVKYIGLNHLKDGTSNPSLSRDTFADLLLPLPPLAVQRSIVAVVKSLDDKIELNRRMNETLEAMARALFKSWFVDFDPVRAKLEGRQPAGMDKATAALFPDSFQDSPLGKIPKGWRVAAIGDVVRAVGGGTPSTAEPAYWSGGIHHFATPKDLAGLSSPMLLDTERKVTEAALARISSGLLPPGTLLLSSRAPIGYLAIAQMPVAVNQGFIAMMCGDAVSSYFMLNWAHFNMDEIERRASGTIFLEISKQNFRPIPMVVPPTTVASRFDTSVKPLFDEIVANLRQAQSVTALRDTLLPKLLSGDIRVPDAERIVGRHV